MAIDKQLGYALETEALIQRMCENVERKSFRLNKKKAEEALLKTYDLFGLNRPQKIIWYNDPFEEKYQEAAGSAWSAWSARSAGSAGSAGSAWSAGSAGSAWSARSAGSAWSARSARSAWSARSAGSAGSARSAGSAGSAWSARSAEWSALDYDFDWFVTEYEYCQNPSDNAPNEHDRKYLEYSELLMQAKEYGLGYRVEYDGVLRLAPTPIVAIDDQNRWHSEIGPAIRWKGGEEHHYLRGQSLEKKIWKKVVGGTFGISDLMQIQDSDTRAVVIGLVKPSELLEKLEAKLIHTGKKGTRLYEVNKFSEKVRELVSEDYETSENDTEYCMLMDDASTDRVFLEWVNPEVGKKANADLAQAEAWGITLKEYLSIEQEA